MVDNSLHLTEKPNMAVVELVKFAASEAFINDQSSGKEFYDLLKSSDGCLALYYGLHQEDPKIGIITVVWETYEHHQKLMEAPHYPNFLEHAKPLSVGDFQIQHIPVDVDPTAAFTAPITEFGYLTPKEGKDEEECLRILRESGGLVSVAKGVHPPAVWGEIRENPRHYRVIVGWEGLEAHATAAVGELKLVVDKTMAAFDITVVHAKLAKHV